jgi:hypothetical protein
MMTDKCTRTSAISKCIAADPQFFQLVKAANTQWLWDASQHPASDGSNQHGGDGAGTRATAEDTLARLRREHQDKAWKKFQGIVDEHVKAGETRSEAMTRAVKENTGLWTSAKGEPSPVA